MKQREAESWSDWLTVVLFRKDWTWILETGLASSDYSFHPSTMLLIHTKGRTRPETLNSTLEFFSNKAMQSLTCKADGSLCAKSWWKWATALPRSAYTGSPPLPSRCCTLTESEGQESHLAFILGSFPPSDDNDDNMLSSTTSKENDSRGHHVSNHLDRNGTTFSFVFLPSFQL